MTLMTLVTLFTRIYEILYVLDNVFFQVEFPVIPMHQTLRPLYSTRACVPLHTFMPQINDRKTHEG